jgi:hypothetical protein
MRWPIASGVVDTVLNTSTVTSGSSYVAGMAVDPDNKLQVSTDAVADAVFVGGIACTADGIVFVATTGGDHGVGGLTVTADGALLVTAGGTPVNYVGGIPLDSAGAVCVGTVT